jgi:hypothetical protein
MKVLVFAVMFGLGMLVGVGCESKHMRDPEPIVSTPLEFDPTEHYELSRWWTNGTQMLRLDNNAGYALYADQNRYRTPTQKGRWSQQSYAVLWLEPYTQREPERLRVGISKINGKLALTVPKYKSMYAIKNPPEVTEDRLFGTWQSQAGRLRLGSDMRYSFSPIANDGNSTNMRTGENGNWSIAGDRIILQPNVPGRDAIRLNMIIEEKRVTISGPPPDGEYTRQAEPAA